MLRKTAIGLILGLLIGVVVDGVGLWQCINGVEDRAIPEGFPESEKRGLQSMCWVGAIWGLPIIAGGGAVLGTVIGAFVGLFTLPAGFDHVFAPYGREGSTQKQQRPEEP